jgi:hypothetical protein
MKTLLLFASLLVCSTSASARIVVDQLRGQYQGKITMWEDNYEVPISLVLNLVAENDPNTEELVSIVGSFTIDGEGGPFTFSKISLDINNGELDMRYTRPNRARILNMPVHFRMIGKLVPNTSPLEIEGEVISGFQGPIGTFKLARTGDELSLTSVPKYHGNWRGGANFRSGYSDFSIRIASTGMQTLNPEHMEFDYTAGKMGSVFVRDIGIPILTVYVDYLRGRLFLIQGQPNSQATVTFESRIDTNGDMIGNINSTLIGPNGDFRVTPVP